MLLPDSFREEGARWVTPQGLEHRSQRVANVDAKALQDDLQSLGFTPSLAKPEMGKRLENEVPVHKIKE